MDATRSQTAPASLPRITRGTVRVVVGEDRGTAIELGDRPVVVGSGDECDLRLVDPRVSRRHLEIALAPRGFLVKDLGSRNGTYLNGAKVGEVAVPPGANVTVGDTVLWLLADSEPVSAAPSEAERFGGLVGRSQVIRRVFTQLEQAAASDAGVLLTGETGTGKEIAARALHAASRRAAAPFVVVDCGAVVPQLFAATLFGCVRGGVPGVDAELAGMCEEAAGGTLFLDEIAALPFDLQPALLRLCDEHTIVRVGEVARREVDVRIVAATRRDLGLEVAAGRFREDLFYRLKVLSIAMPPLRARREDFPQLIEEILHGLGVADVGPLRGESMSRLLQHGWPGNVRELHAVLAGAVSAAPGKRFADLAIGLVPRLDADQLGGDDSFQGQKKAAIDEFERAYLERLLSESGGNIRRACRASGIERTQLKRLLDKHGLR